MLHLHRFGFPYQYPATLGRPLQPLCWLEHVSAFLGYGLVSFMAFWTIGVLTEMVLDCIPFSDITTGPEHCSVEIEDSVK